MNHSEEYDLDVAEVPRSATRLRAAHIRPASFATSSIHVLLSLPSDVDRARLLAAVGTDVRVTLLDPRDPLPDVSPIDVAVLHVEHLNLACSPLLSNRELGFPELAFVIDRAGSAQHLALRSRGFRHVVPAAELPEWFPRAMPQLGSLARARRVVLDACEGDQAALHVVQSTRTAVGVTLHAAETHFREIFLRSLLAEYGSRRKAAEVAGVPYRSFCEMLRKLGI